MKVAIYERYKWHNYLLPINILYETAKMIMEVSTCTDFFISYSMVIKRNKQNCYRQD